MALISRCAWCDRLLFFWQRSGHLILGPATFRWHSDCRPETRL